MKLRRFLTSAIVAAALGAAGAAHASLSAFQVFTGAGIGVSTDGFGSTGSSGTISAFVPLGSSVVAAYLYTSTWTFTGSNPLPASGASLAGSTVGAFTSLGDLYPNAVTYPGFVLTAGRVDITSIVKPLIDGGIGGAYNFAISETNTGSQDGEALVVIYNDGTAGINTVGILDGFSATGGDSTSINFGSALDPAAPGFFAEMRLGIGFSAGPSNGQSSYVTVNGTTITKEAGDYDDGVGANGALITVGGSDDAFMVPGQDRERYNLIPYISSGDTSIIVRTNNPSNDDNIFLAVFNVRGAADICVTGDCNDVPEPASLVLVGLALAGLGAQRRFAKRI